MQGLREIVLIHDLKKQGLSLSAIARKVGCDRKTVRKYLERGLEAPIYGPRQPRDCLLDPYEDYLRERVLTFPDLSGARLLREIREMGYEGGYTRVTDFLRQVRPPARVRFERRFETPPGLSDYRSNRERLDLRYELSWRYLWSRRPPLGAPPDGSSEEKCVATLNTQDDVLVVGVAT